MSDGPVSPVDDDATPANAAAPPDGLTASAGAAVGPLIIVGVVVAYLASLGFEGRLSAKGIAFTPPTGS